MLGVLVTGVALGLLWILSDLAFFTGIIGWIAFAIVGLPLYGIGEVIWANIFSKETGDQISKKAFSWKRVGYGLFLEQEDLVEKTRVFLTISSRRFRGFMNKGLGRSKEKS